MKKLICLFSFIAFGYLAANAQSQQSNVAPAAMSASPGNEAATLVQQDKPVAASAAKETGKKKEACSSADKKQCGSKSAGKSCCAHKTEAKKEDTK